MELVHEIIPFLMVHMLLNHILYTCLSHLQSPQCKSLPSRRLLKGCF